MRSTVSAGSGDVGRPAPNAGWRPFYSQQDGFSKTAIVDRMEKRIVLRSSQFVFCIGTGAPRPASFLQRTAGEVRPFF